MLDMENDALFDKNKKRALETVSPNLNGTDHQTVIPSAYGAKVLNHLDTLVKEYKNSSYTKEKTFIAEVADALGIPREKFNDKSIQYATINCGKEDCRQYQSKRDNGRGYCLPVLSTYR